MLGAGCGCSWAVSVRGWLVLVTCTWLYILLLFFLVLIFFIFSGAHSWVSDNSSTCPIPAAPCDIPTTFSTSQDDFGLPPPQRILTFPSTFPQRSQPPKMLGFSKSLDICLLSLRCRCCRCGVAAVVATKPVTTVLALFVNVLHLY